MKEGSSTSQISEGPVVAEGSSTAEEHKTSTKDSRTRRAFPDEETIEEYEEEMERIVSAIEEEYIGGDSENEIEFGLLEIAREEHEAMLNATDREKPKYPHFQYMVDGLLPLHEVHIVAGETGAGKSTWLFDNLISPWQHEQPVLGRKSHWFPYVIFVNDRSKAGMIRMLQRLHLNPKQFPIKSTITESKMTLVQKIESFHEANPSLKIVFIEGLHVGQKDGNDYGESSAIMQELNALCQKRRLTIIATTHVSKSNAQLGATDRTAIIGSSATPGMCETVFVLAKQKKGGRVRLTVHPRNERALAQLYKWTESGKLVETEEQEDQDRFVSYLNQLETETFKTEDVVEFYQKKFKVGRDTVQNEIKRAVRKEWIEPCIDDGTGKKKKGHYKKIEVQWGEEEN